MLLFSDRSLLTMVHGLVLSGGAMMAMAAALFALQAMALPQGTPVPGRQSRWLAWLTTGAAVLVWLSVLGGVYIVFPIYRATPPEDVLSLAAYPRAFLLSTPETRWLHAFGMEVKEHLPWVAAMLATAVAFVATRYRSTLLADRTLRTMAVTLTTIAFALVLFVGLLGVFVNKIAPVE